MAKPGVVRRIASPLILETYNIPEWSEEQVTDLLCSPLNPSASIPIICRGKGKCPQKHGCFLTDDELNNAMGELCPIERRLVAELFFGYASHLKVGPADYVDISILWHLVRLTIQARRLDAHLQKDDVLKMMVFGIDKETGMLIENPAIHPAVDGQDKLLKSVMQLYSKMIATRKDKVDASTKGSSTGKDPLSIMAMGRGFLASQAKESEEQ